MKQQESKYSKTSFVTVVCVVVSWTMQMQYLMLMVTSYLTSICSLCFLPDEMPPFTVGLNTTANTTDMGEDEAQIKDEIELLRKWDSILEEHFVSYLMQMTDIEEWMDCYSDTATFNFADGPGSAMSVDEYRIVAKTYPQLLTIEDIVISNGSAEFIDDHTIEVSFIQTISPQFGVMRDMLPFIAGDEETEWEMWTTWRFRFDDNGLMEEFVVVSPEWVRQIGGAVLTVYVTTSGPITTMAPDTQETLTIFGYNAIVVILLALMFVTTTLVATCVFLSMRYCARRGSQLVVYKKVEIVTDTEME